MIALQALLMMLNEHKSKVLLVAESSLPESQYRAFRKLLLMEFGAKGLEGKLQKLYAESHHQQGRNGRE